MLLNDSLETAILQTLYAKLNTILVGKILEVTSLEPPEVVVEIMLKRKYKNGFEIDYPNIKGVPLVMPSVKDCVIKFPKASLVGTGVVILCCQRSIDTYINTGEKNVPVVNTKFDISDAIAFPGLWDFKKGNSNFTDNDNFEIIYKDASFTIKDDGVIEIKNSMGSIIMGTDGSVDINNGNFKVII